MAARVIISDAGMAAQTPQPGKTAGSIQNIGTKTMIPRISVNIIAFSAFSML